MSKVNLLKHLKSLTDRDKAVESGLDHIDQSVDARMQRAKEMEYITDIDSVIETGHGKNRARTVEDGHTAGASGRSSEVSESTGRGENAGRVQAGDGDDPATFYHGTSDDITEFVIDHPNKKDNGWLGRGIYISNEPAMASHYANAKKGGAAPNVLPVHLRSKNLYESSLEEKGRLMHSSQEEVAAFTNDLINKGYDGATLQFGDGTREIVVFDPSHIRSVNATFDPAKKNSTNLLASAAGVTTVGAAIIQSDQTYASEIDTNLSTAMLKEKAGVDMDYINSFDEPEEQPAEQEEGEGLTAGTVAKNVIEGATQIPAGVSKAVNEVNNTLNDFDDWATTQFSKLIGSDPKLAKEIADGQFQPMELLASIGQAYENFVGEPDTATGAITKEFAAILAPIGAYAKGLKAAGWTAEGVSGVARVLTAETLAGATALDPFDEGFAGMLQEFGIENDMIAWMANKDTAAEGRVKNALEAVGVGTAFEGVFKGIGLTSKVAKKLAKSPLGMKIVGAMGSLWYARRLLKKDSPQAEAAAQQAIEAERMAVLRDAAGDPNQPSFNHGAKSIDEVEINFSRIETDDDVKDLIQELADSDIAEIDKARRGVVGWDQTQMEAGQIDAWDMLQGRRQGDPLNASQTVAARNLWLQSGERASSLAKQVSIDPSPMNMVAYKRQLVLHSAIQRQVLGARAETGRALNAWKIPSNTADLQTITDQLTNEQDILEIARKHLTLTEAGRSVEADTFVYGSAFAKGRDAVASLWYFSLLSGAKTHMRNIIGNSLVSIIHPIEREMAAGIGRMKGSEQVVQGEGMAFMYGMLAGTARALRVSRETDRMGTVWTSLKTGESGVGIGKIDLPMISGLNPEKLGIDKNNPIYWLARVADATVSAPGRALAGADEFFKTITYDGEIQAQAFREASQKIKSGEIPEEQFWQEIQRMTRNPEEYMQLGARVRAQRNTFTDTPERTKAFKAWEGIGNIPILGKLVLPFKRTPYNIALYNFERTPLAPLVKRFRDDIAAGGVRGDMAQAQWVMGNSLLLMGADAALNGSITGGGPSEPKAREAWLQEHAPYSFEYKLEDGTTRTFSYLGIEPIGTFLSLSSSIVDILTTQDWDDKNKVVSEMILASTISIAATSTSQQFMRGLSDFMEMMNDPQRNAEYYFNRLGGMVVPTGVAQFARAGDPNMRYVGSMIDAIKARTPGLSRELPATYDRWGKERTRASKMGPVYDGISPFYSRDIKPEPIDLELRRLNKFVGKPNGRQTFHDPFNKRQGGIEINLKDHFPHAYWRLVELRGDEVTETVHGAPITATNFVSTGKTLKEELNMIAQGEHPSVPDDLYQMFTDGEDGYKARYLTNIISAFNQAAKDQLLKEFPDLKAEVESRNNTPKFKFQEAQ